MNPRRATAIGLLILLLLLSSQGQQSAANDATKSDVPTREQVLEFLDLMHAKAQMTQVMHGMVLEMRKGAEQGFKSEVPNPTPEQVSKLDALFDSEFESIPVDEMIEAMVPIYQKHLTKSDLAGATAFYLSPTGQKILKELPAITSEAMEAGGEIGRRSFAAKTEKFEEKLADLIKELKK